MAIVEFRKRPSRIEVTQSLNTIITTTRVEMVVAPNINVVRGGILIGYVTNVGHGLGRVR